jgi:hypothetical protein
MIRLLHRLNRDARNMLGLRLSGASTHHRVQHIQRLRGKGPTIQFSSDLQKWISPETPTLLIQQPAVDLYRLKDCRITGLQGHIFPEKHVYLDLGESLFGMHPDKILPPIEFLEKKLAHPLFYLAENSVSRAHAVIEHLPRYQIAAPFLPPDVRPLVQKNQSYWQNEYIHLTGCRSPCCETSFGTLSAADIYFVPMAGKSVTNLIGEPHHYLEMKRLGLKALVCEQGPVFISRNDASRRRLLNEAELFRIAQNMMPDIKLVELGKLSLKEQIAVIARASILISPHGQGSHLSLFSQNAVTIQLVPGQANLSNAFYECALLYDYFASFDRSNKTASIVSEQSMAGYHEHWSYPPEKFASELRQILYRVL